MKRPTEKRSDGEMKFFTPELYLRYNSSDDAEADRADSDWEVALNAYKKHLKSIAPYMNERVCDLAEKRSFHDSELLSIQEDLPQDMSLKLKSMHAPFAVATITLRDAGMISNLVYLLWEKIQQTRAKRQWPFSKTHTHWLYDEIDVKRESSTPAMYTHRILLSDGRVLTVPFFDVVVQAFSDKPSETAIIRKKRA